MLDYRHILFPVDFSDRCAAARPFVAALVRHCQAELTLLHATGWRGLSGVAKAEAQLEEFAAEGGLGAGHRHVASGDPVPAITRYVQDRGIDLTVLPTLGFGPVRRFLLGSTAAKLLHDLPCHMITLANPEEAALRPLAPGSAVVCALEADDQLPASLQVAACWAQELAGSLVAVHALPVLEQSLWQLLGPEPPPLSTASARAKLERLVAEQGLTTELELDVEAGDVGYVVARHARRCHAGLVVVGRGRHTAEGRLGRHTMAVAHGAPCPVLSL